MDRNTQLNRVMDMDTHLNRIMDMKINTIMLIENKDTQTVLPEIVLSTPEKFVLPDIARHFRTVSMENAKITLLTEKYENINNYIESF